MKKLWIALTSLFTAFSFLPILAEDFGFEEEPPDFMTDQLLPTWLNIVIIVVVCLAAIGIILGIIKKGMNKKVK